MHEHNEMVAMLVAQTRTLVFFIVFTSVCTNNIAIWIKDETLKRAHMYMELRRYLEITEDRSEVSLGLYSSYKYSLGD